MRNFVIVILMAIALNSYGQNRVILDIMNENNSEGYVFLNSYQGKEKTVEHKIVLNCKKVKIVKVAYVKKLNGKIKILFKEEIITDIKGLKILKFSYYKKVNYAIILMTKFNTL